MASGTPQIQVEIPRASSLIWALSNWSPKSGTTCLQEVNEDQRLPSWKELDFQGCFEKCIQRKKALKLVRTMWWSRELIRKVIGLSLIRFWCLKVKVNVNLITQELKEGMSSSVHLKLIKDEQIWFWWSKVKFTVISCLSWIAILSHLAETSTCTREQTWTDIHIKDSFTVWRRRKTTLQ